MPPVGQALTWLSVLHDTKAPGEAAGADGK
jgi:hypothetical protein